MEPLPVSVLLLARDEAARIGALIRSLSFAREVVVVVDAASRDDTAAVAERAGARVFVRAFDGFGAQRRFALAQCREPWVLWIDADEALAPGAGARIAAAIAAPAAAGWRIERVTWFLGRRIRWCGWRGERVLRLFRRDAASFDDQPVHETVRVEGHVADLGAVIEHHSYDTWADCVQKMVRYAAAGAEQARRVDRGATWLDVIARPPLRFVRMYVLQLGVLDGAHGLVLCALAAVQVFLKYAELWAGARRRA
jgi:glycosyltransferase involved in cell wall biosynthesis